MAARAIKAVKNAQAKVAREKVKAELERQMTVGERELPAGMQPEMLETIRRLTPLGRAGTPEDAANAIYLFCCPESDFVSGQVLVASGGLAL